MRPQVVDKFGFRIRTRRGIVIDVALPGRDAVDAERKLHQIYRECAVLARQIGAVAQPVAGASGGAPEAASQS
jgi:hypothetical protein